MHEYMKRLIRSVEKGIICSEVVAHAFVGHDHDCGFFVGGYCDCDPSITIETQDGTSYVLADGTVTTTKPS